MAYEDEEKKQYMVIKIKKPHHAERLAWIVLIAFLLTVILFQWISWPEEVVCPEDSATDESVAGQKPAVIETTNVDKTEEKPVEKKEEKPAEKSAIKEEPKAEEKKLSGRIEVAISNVATEKKNSDFGKILSITYSIDNQKKDFVPLVRLFLLDSENNEELYTDELTKRCCEQQPLMSLPLKAGAPVLEKSFAPFNGDGFRVSNLNETKTIRMNVYDKEDTKTLLAATEFDIRSNAWK